MKKGERGGGKQKIIQFQSPAALTLPEVTIATGSRPRHGDGGGGPQGQMREKEREQHKAQANHPAASTVRVNPSTAAPHADECSQTNLQRQRRKHFPFTRN